MCLIWCALGEQEYTFFRLKNTKTRPWRNKTTTWRYWEQNLTASIFGDKKMTTALRFQEQNITIENQRIKNHEMEFGWNSNPYFPWSGAIDFLCEYAEIPSRSLLNDSNFWKTDKNVFKKELNSFSVIPWLYPTSCDNFKTSHLDLGHSWRPCVH